MKFATHNGQLASEFDPFGENMLAEIMETVVTTWSKMRRFTPQEIMKRWTAKGKRKNGPPPVEPHENWITDRLAGLILNDPQFRNLPFDVAPQHRLIDIDGNEPGRIDLYFKHRHSHRAYFAFEAKRLHVTYPGGSNSKEYATYISDAGMEAYVLGQYSEGFPAAGMLGYVMDGQTAVAWEGLKASIETRREQLRMRSSGTLMISPLKTSQGISMPLSLLGKTLHHLAGRTLELLHLILPYG